MNNTSIYFLHNRKKNDAVEMVFFDKITRNRTYYSPKIKVPAKNWDSKKDLVKGNHPFRDDHNIVLENLKHVSHSVCRDLYLKHGFVDIKKLKSLMILSLQDVDEKATECFIEYMEYQITEGSKCDLKPATKKQYRNCIFHLKDYQKGKKLEFHQISPVYLERFNSYLLKLKLDNNTRWKIFKWMKATYKIAIRDKILKVDDFPFGPGKFQIVYKAPRKKALSIQEVQRIEELEIDSNEVGLIQARDIFLFCCYTGLRFSDVVRLSFEHFREVGDQLLLELRQEKTDRLITVPLSDLFKDEKGRSKPERIVRMKFLEFGEDLNSPVGHRYFFKLSNQYLNRQLKELGTLAKIKIPLTAHLARHTCATMLVADYKIPPEIAQQILGHSDLKMTQSYLHVRGEHISSALKSVSW